MTYYHPSIDITKLPVPAIIFELPQGAAGMAASMGHSRVISEMTKWSEKYNIKFTHNRVCSNVVEVYLDGDDTKYSFFCLTWNQVPYRIANDISDRVVHNRT